jgi:DNA-binding MarR family transcriptional regulator
VQGLPDLLSRALLGFALEYEKASGFSLAMSANVVRLVSEKGVRVRDIPGLAGVSKEAAAMALKRLEESESACVTAESATSRTRVVVLTPKGVQMQEAYLEFTQKVEKHWQASFGKDQIDNLRLLLEQLAVESTGKRSPLFAGLEPYADGWRASLPRREVLPHYPMILHRGGFPDGS